MSNTGPSGLNNALSALTQQAHNGYGTTTTNSSYSNANHIPYSNSYSNSPYTNQIFQGVGQMNSIYGAGSTLNSHYTKHHLFLTIHPETKDSSWKMAINNTPLIEGVEIFLETTVEITTGNIPLFHVSVFLATLNEEDSNNCGLIINYNDYAAGNMIATTGIYGSFTNINVPPSTYNNTTPTYKSSYSPTYSLYFKTKKLQIQYHEFLEKYKARFPKDSFTYHQLPDFAYENSGKTHTIDIVKSKATNSIEIFNEWVWIVKNCSCKVYRLQSNWLFENEAESVGFILSME